MAKSVKGLEAYHFEQLDLAAIAKKIDYEKACNRGLYDETISDLVAVLSEDDLLSILDFCNDSNMKLYQMHKKADWAKFLTEHQLYAVLNCLTEDSIAHAKKFECHELATHLTAIRKRKVTAEKSVSRSEQIGAGITESDSVGDLTSFMDESSTFIKNESGILN